MYSYPIETEDLLEFTAPPAAARRIGAHLEIADGCVRFVDAIKAASLPLVWVEAFRVAIAEGCAVSDQVQQCIRQNLGRHAADDFVATRGERMQLRKLLHPRPGLHARLLEMRRCGLLTLIFPELAAAHRYDGAHPHIVHKFDDRDLAPIERLEALRLATNGHGSRFRAMLDEVNAPELLTLALLLDRRGHRDHDEPAAVQLSRQALERLQLTAEARRTVEFLVANRPHATRLAFRRDASDPSVVAHFAQMAANDQWLKMICLMTLAHVQTVGGDSDGAWKEDLLWKLFVTTRHRVMLGDRATELQPDQASRAVALAGRPHDMAEAELTQFLDSVPDRYLTIFGVSAVYGHVRLARGIRPDDVHTSLERHDDIWKLTIVSLRKRHLFSLAAGVLSAFGMDIHRAQAMTTPDDLVIDVFEFSDGRGLLSCTPGATSELDRMLHAVADGTVDVDALVDRTPLAPAHIRPAHVSVTHERAGAYTVVEIEADDARGLLHRVARAIAAFGCDVDLALASTEGERVHDILHVTRHRRRLSEVDRETLRQQLETV